MGRDNQIVLLFDGDCAFCQMCVNVGRKSLAYMPGVRAWQFADLGALGLTRGEAAASVQLVGPNGLHASGARAIAVMLSLQPHPAWRTAGRIMLTPPVSWVAETGYRLVSRYRHHLPGTPGATAV
ncbi:thiol-disulfide oxidoreductase DCC family protein [Planotetraspora sp. GP83]|uniref:thiol-disulfide oxidoreductase DCC family protein n=1 Tax=Planotetraspora sp. GP83 TaxID=3156264 RepID=UPI0035135788